jgi:RNA polymerase sigma-70 factor, ECF subfamily
MFGRNTRAKTEEFETACMSHMDSLYASALKMTRNQVEAEELVQDTFVRAFRFKKNFEWGTNLKAWLFRILTNTFINDYRHRKHEQKYMERAAVEPLYDEVLNRHAAEYAANPENHVFTKFFKEDLDQALNEVPEDFRIAVVLSDIEGFSYKEIAEILDKPIGTVMSRLHRGRKLLQRSLVDYAVEAGVIPNTLEENTVPSNVTPLHSKKESK